MQILDKANGVTLLSAGGGWFFRLEGEEVKFYVTQNEKWDGHMIAEHTFSRAGLMVLGQAAFPVPEYMVRDYENGSLINALRELPPLTPGEFIPVEETVEPAGVEEEVNVAEEAFEKFILSDAADTNVGNIYSYPPEDTTPAKKKKSKKDAK